MNMTQKLKLNHKFVDSLNRAQYGNLSYEQKAKIFDDPLMFHAKEIGGLLKLEDSLASDLYDEKLPITLLWKMVSDDDQLQSQLLHAAWKNNTSTGKIELGDGVSDEISELVSSPNDGNAASIELKKARILHFLSLGMLYQATIANQHDDASMTSIQLTGAAMLFGMACGAIFSIKGANATSQLSIQMMGALAKIARDPKQAAKKNVRDCWERWQKNKNEYKSKSAFSRAMLDKYESLESQRVIERWCKEWESEPS